MQLDSKTHAKNSSGLRACSQALADVIGDGNHKPPVTTFYLFWKWRCLAHAFNSLDGSPIQEFFPGTAGECDVLDFTIADYRECHQNLSLQTSAPGL